MKNAYISVTTRSTIIYNGICSLLRKTQDIVFSFVSVPGSELPDVISEGEISVAIIDPASLDNISITSLRERCGNGVKLVLLRNSVYPDTYTGYFDATISIYDSQQAIAETIGSLFATNQEQTISDDLTSREKEIIVGVVKGLSNKEIALEMNISANTVMTHRRNIAAKLQIHSPAGLTIYALANKLVKLEDVTKSPM